MLDWLTTGITFTSTMTSGRPSAFRFDHHLIAFLFGFCERPSHQDQGNEKASRKSIFPSLVEGAQLSQVSTIDFPECAGLQMQAEESSMHVAFRWHSRLAIRSSSPSMCFRCPSSFFQPVLDLSPERTTATQSNIQPNTICSPHTLPFLPC